MYKYTITFDESGKNHVSSTQDFVKPLDALKECVNYISSKKIKPEDVLLVQVGTGQLHFVEPLTAIYV